MAELSDAQRKRAEARKRRRGQSRDAEPEQQNDGAVSEGSDEAPDPRQAVVQAATLGDAKQAAERAREQLEALLGRPIESVSSLERTHDGWVLNFEVLEL